MSWPRNKMMIEGPDGLANLVDIPELAPWPSVQSPADEDDRERKWAEFIGDCRDFAASEKDGYAAVLRAVAEALKTDDR